MAEGKMTMVELTLERESDGEFKYTITKDNGEFIDSQEDVTDDSEVIAACVSDMLAEDLDIDTF